jgi:regulator of replication initiation timing
MNLNLGSATYSNASLKLIRATKERQGELAQDLSVARNEVRHGAVLAQEFLIVIETTKELERQLSDANSTATALGAELAEVLECNGQLQLALEGSRKGVEEQATFSEMREAELSSKLLTTDMMRQSLGDATAVVKNASRVE